MHLWLAAMFAIAGASLGASRDRAAPAPAVPDDATHVEAELDADSRATDSVPLQSIGEGFTVGAIVDLPRRLSSLRLRLSLRPPIERTADCPSRATLLKLREAGRNRLEIARALDRMACGAASFHTVTPPPDPIV